MQTSKTHFVLKGFRPEVDVRVFSFDRVAVDHSRSAFTVTVDLALARRYGVPLQELPVLCRTLLEGLNAAAGKTAFAFTESDMLLYADGVAERAQAARLKRPPRRVRTENSGAAWRTTRQV